MVWLRGRECKLGWGYNHSLDLLIRVDGEATNVRSEKWNLWKYAVYSLSSNDIDNWVNFLFIDKICYKSFRMP